MASAPTMYFLEESTFVCPPILCTPNNICLILLCMCLRAHAYGIYEQMDEQKKMQVIAAALCLHCVCVYYAVCGK